MMDNKKVKPGDVILINDEAGIFPELRGEEKVVIACPERYKGTIHDKENVAWFEWDGGNIYLNDRYYSILQTHDPSTSCVPDSVDESLDRQSDENLRSVLDKYFQ